MKKVTCQLLTLLSICLLSFSYAYSQPGAVFLKTQTGKSAPNLLQSEPSEGLYQSSEYNHKYYLLLRFAQLPGEKTNAALQSAGITLGDYMSNSAYLAECSKLPNHNTLRQLGVSGIYEMSPATRIDVAVLKYTDAELSAPGMVVAVSWFGSLGAEKVTEELVRYGAQPVSLKYTVPNTIFVQATRATIDRMAALPFVSYIAAESTTDHELNYANRAVHSLDALNAPNIRNLQGSGVTVGIGDNSNASQHIDIVNRLLVRTSTGVVNHGTHVTGTVGGAGTVHPLYRGMAPATRLIGQLFSDVITHTPIYIHDYGMVLTNNSYFSGAVGCTGSSVYNFLSRYVDSQLYVTPSILHVFAVGNDGLYTCGTFPTSYGTVKSGFQCAKNVLTVGAIDNSTNLVLPGSSKGPVEDGRIKPEILAGGLSIISTIPGNVYTPISGTSMASPTVTGALALLYERYRQLHGGNNPDGALIKALITNSAEDIGTTGPDYACGFGMMNARRAVENMENNRYQQGTIIQGDSQTVTITGVPAGAQLKVMLYWADKAANTAAATALVNDLDLTVVEPGPGTVHRPLILNPISVTSIAQEGRDSINNIEQVMMVAPSSGNYTVGIKGRLIPSGTQAYVVTYQVLAPSVTLDYPVGGEKWVPGQTEKIRWTAFGTGNNTFNLDYSLNGGASWNAITTNLPAGSVNYSWTIPADSASEHALVRITCNTLGYTSTSTQQFTILGQPTLIALTNPCPGYASLTWNTIKNAQDYEVLLYKGSDTLTSLGFTTDTTFQVSGLNPQGSYFLATQARFATGTTGLRSIALAVNPAAGACTGAMFNDDYALDSLMSPVTGRANTLSQPGVATIQWRLRNYGSVAAPAVDTLYYQVNGGTVIAQNISQTVPASGTATVTSAATVNFGVPGSYTVKAWIKHPNDTQHANDTVTAVVKHLSNIAINLAPSFTEGFETAAEQTLTANAMGLTNLDRADYNTSNSNGRVRTRVDTGFARTGSRCITLDQKMNMPQTSQNSLTTTYNLSNYATTDNIWLNFYLKNHGVDFTAPGNRVWIRGNDQASWIPVLTLPTAVTQIGIYQSSPFYNIREKLADSGQVISSSFQVRFGQEGYTSANAVYPTGTSDDGYSFDDFTLTKTNNDISLMQVLQPTIQGQCNLGANEPIVFKIKNYTPGTISNVPVAIMINATIIHDTISALPSGESTFSFGTTANLSAFQHYDVKAWVNMSGDDFRNNDSITYSFQTTPYITSFPYLEGFESNNGYWYSQGINNTWQWGTPNKDVITKAANGTKIWTTNLTGPYNDNEFSYLYSPCFNLSTLTAPMLSFSHLVQLEDACVCDFSWMEYSLNDTTWTKLGVQGSGTNWYDFTGNQTWRGPNNNWHVASYGLPAGAPKIRFRYVMASDAGSNFAGIGVDDVHIFDQQTIYADSSLRNGITQTVSGSSWTDFTANGKRVLSINANGQNLGATTLKTYLYPGPIRFVGTQYYLNRNMVIHTANTPASPVTLRFYFLDSEAKDLMNATGCATCTSIKNPYESGFTQYSGIQAEEDDTFTNNYSGGLYQFILPGTQVKVVPFNNGYYAEFNVNGFSEFWLNGGGPNQNLPLPLSLRSFTATKIDDKGQLNWSTENEVNSDRFDIEKSINGRDYYVIGNVKAINKASDINFYGFTDNQLMNGTNYYRLKIIDNNKQFSYSQVRTIRYDKMGNDVIIYPNPVSGGKVYVRSTANCSKIEISDITGKVIRTQYTSGWLNAFMLTGISKGVYMLDVYTDMGKKTEKLVVE